MRSQLVKIGNSKGIVIPKAILAQLNMEQKGVLDLIVQNGAIVLVPEKDENPRKGWGEAFALAVKDDGDVPPEDILDFPNEFDEKEWTW